METAARISRSAARFGPCSIPSRPTSVKMIRLAPIPAMRAAKVTAGSSVRSCQPETATKPSLASTPMTTRSPYIISAPRTISSS